MTSSAKQTPFVLGAIAASVVGLLIGYTSSTILPDLFYTARMMIIEMSPKKPDVNVDDEGITFESMVYPSDIDRNGHMNNSRYLRELNFSRRHFFVTTGIWHILKEIGANFFIRSQTIRYRKEMVVWSRYTIRTKLIAWSDAEKCFYIESRFERRGFVYAVHLAKYSIVSDKNQKTIDASTLVPSELLKMAGISSRRLRETENQQGEGSNGLPPMIVAWNESNDISSKELNPSKKDKA
jgi:acyl-CoA thioesterase FadM